MKTITEEQINTILKLVYSTNITAQGYDSLKEYFKNLPDISVEVAKETSTV